MAEPANDPALDVILRKTNLGKLKDNTNTKGIFDELIKFFRDSIKTSIAVSCGPLPCGGRTRTFGPPPDGSNIIPYPYPAPLKKPDEEKVVRLPGRPEALAAVGTTYVRAEPVSSAGRVGFFDSIEDTVVPIAPAAVGAVYLGELARASEGGQPRHLLKADRKDAGTVEVGSGSGKGADAATDKTTDVKKTCKGFYGPVKAIGSGKINFTTAFAVTVPGPGGVGSVTATLTVQADAGMSVEALTVHIDGGPCDPPDCKDETTLRADVLARFWGNLLLSATLAITIPILGTIAGGANITKFGVACEDKIELSTNC